MFFLQFGFLQNLRPRPAPNSLAIQAGLLYPPSAPFYKAKHYFRISPCRKAESRPKLVFVAYSSKMAETVQSRVPAAVKACLELCSGAAPCSVASFTNGLRML